MKMNNKYNSKIDECILKLLCVKRKILNDTEYVNRGFIERSYRIELPKNKLEEMHKNIINNVYWIYLYNQIDFSKCVENFIESYSNHPVLYLVNKVEIGDNELYTMNAEENNKSDSIFKRYYDNIGNEYIKNNYKKLNNKFYGSCYDNMCEYIKREINFKISLINTYINNNDISIIKNKINLNRLDSDFKIDNLYVEMATQIIGIEVNIYKILKQNNIEANLSIEKNIEYLFERYIDNNFCRNAIMYVYYILYCDKGYQLRNAIMHGNLLGKNNYADELIMIYSCVIAISTIIEG